MYKDAQQMNNLMKLNRVAQEGYVLVEIFVGLFGRSAVAKSWLKDNAESWSWMGEFAKEITLLTTLGGDSAVLFRDAKKVEVVNHLCSFLEVPDLTMDLSEGNSCYFVEGSGLDFINGKYVFEGYFDGVPYYQKSSTVKLRNGMVQEKVISIFRCKLRTGKR